MKKLGAFLAALAVLVVAPLASAGPGKTLGFNVHQSADVGMDATHDAGLGWVRIDLNWTDAEPTTQGTFNWAVFDAQMAAAASRKLNVLAVLAYTPAWASAGDEKADGSLNDVPKPGTYAAFVSAAVGRYKGQVTHYELWNEPNLGQFFEGTPQDYLSRVLDSGADAVHAACPTCQVVGPGLATVGTEYATWMDAVLASATGPKLDIVSGHVYATFPDLNANAGFTSDSFYNKLEKHRVLKAGTVVVYEGPLSFKEVMDKHGVTKPFWLTETGLEATLGDTTAEASQVAYYRDVLDVMLNRPWWQSTIFYESFDEPPAPYHWGAVVHQPSGGKTYTPKAVFAFLQKVTSSQPSFGGTGTDCDDGLDNDLDGKIDYPSDPECTSKSTASEGPAPPPNVEPGVDAGTSVVDGGGTSNNGSTTDAGSGPVGADGDSTTSSNGSGGCSTTGARDLSLATLVSLALLCVRFSRRLRRR